MAKTQNTLQRWEVAVVKAMIAEGKRDQEILAYFSVESGLRLGGRR